MGNVLVFLQQENGKLHSSFQSAIQVGRQAQGFHLGKLFFLLIGAGAEQAAHDVASFGADEIFVVAHDALQHYLAETYAPMIAQIVVEKKISLVSAIATSMGKDLFPRVAGLLDAGLATDVSAVLGSHQFRRITHASNLLQHIEITGEPICVTARQTEFAPARPVENKTSPLTMISIPVVNTFGAEWVELKTQKKERPELTEAKIVVSGGRGLKEKQNFSYLEQLCDLLGGALGASRAACDAGLVPNELQVGQTGKVVAPNLYIAVGISGAIQHVAGMKSSKVIVAINKDPEAPIFQIADYGLVTTWEKAIPELMLELKKRKGITS